MTSLSTAQPRPLPGNHPSGLQRTQSRSQLPKVQLQTGKQTSQPGEIDLTQERAPKRRKTSVGSVAVPVVDLTSTQSTQAQNEYRGVAWPTVVRIHAEKHLERHRDVAIQSLPEKPWGTTLPKETSWQDGRPSVRTRKNVAVPNTPDSILVPSEAPLFEEKRHTDYFPWTGKHPEDVLNEVHMKQGYYDRPPNPPEKELNTAKPALYNAFKHRSGLDSLSALFSLVLDAKRKHGAFSSTSSFKGPPPRVTLTEVKRKSWISDLANPDIPLRKLSKTIPQGIRGSSLLEQCLQNNIPLSRAIWFTKCVGANEIRTLKRKGVNPVVSQGAEVKWLREWTTNIEQFLETLISQCGQPNWKDQTRYCVLLAARLYLENLLDRDHYLDWVLKSAAAANPNNWPFWLMIIHLHRLDLVAFRKKGKQLAELLVLKYNLARGSPGDVLQPLAQNFAAAIKSLVYTKPNCFLMPDSWNECQKALESCLDVQQETNRQIVQRLSFVNKRASGQLNQLGSMAASPTERATEILDSFRTGMLIPQLYGSLCEACPDQELLGLTCLEWCVSRFRSGTSRIYLSARLLRKLRKQNVDVDRVLLNFIFTKSNDKSVDTAALRQLISELSRSNSFPTSKYMQWLSVRGLPRPGSISELILADKSLANSETIILQESTDPQQILTEICVVHSEDHLVNLRTSLLGRAGFDEDMEAAVFEHLRSRIATALADSGKTNATYEYSQQLLNRIPWTIRTRLSYWLRNEMLSLAKANQVDIAGKPPLPGATTLTLKRFQIVRDILERAGDMAILADVLRITSSSRQEDVVATAVDTISMHSAALSAIGAFEPLQMLYGQLYVMLRSVKTSMPLLATALIGLCQQHPIKITPVRALQQDLVRGDRGRAVTACSPFSDGVAESLQQAGATFHDDFEALLQTESNMNDQTMIRLFKVLIDRIEKMQSVEGCEHEVLVLCQLLARLQLCQKSQGDTVIKKWLARLCNNHNQPLSSQLLFSLIYTRCASLEVVVETCQQPPPSSTSRHRLYNHIRQAVVDCVEDDVEEALAYSFKLAVARLSATKPVDLLDIIGTDETGRSSNSPTKSVLVAAVLANPELIKSLSKPAWLVVSQSLSENLYNVNSTDPPEAQARELATSAGPLSLPFCSLRMRMLCQNAATKNDESIQDNVAAMLGAAVADPKSTLATFPHTFQTLLRATGPVISSKVKSSIEQTFLNSLPRFLQSKGLTQPPTPTQAEAEHVATALQQVSLVSTDNTGNASSNSIGGLIEKLTIYMKALGPASATGQQSITSSPVATMAPAMLMGHELYNFLALTVSYLEFLLQFLCMKRPAFSAALSSSPPTAIKSLQQDQIKLVGLLITIGTHPTWPTMLSSLSNREQSSKVRRTLDLVFDVAATLVDDMSDESRTFCARILKDKLKDDRVQWLLGSVNSFGSVQSQDLGHGYQVVHEHKGVLGEWKPKMWEMLESSGSGDSCLGLGLFGARRA